MIDETACLQLVKCVKCGCRWRELWQSHWPLREKERVEQVLSGTVKKGKKNRFHGTGRQKHHQDEIMVRLES
jgi:hypothetical protein